MSGTLERAFVVFFRLAMAWTFLYAASHQVFDPKWSVVGFLSHTKTFHNLFAVFTTPAMALWARAVVGHAARQTKARDASVFLRTPIMRRHS